MHKTVVDARQGTVEGEFMVSDFYDIHTEYCFRIAFTGGNQMGGKSRVACPVEFIDHKMENNFRCFIDLQNS